MGNALEDLKKLVMEGKLEKEVELNIKGTIFKFNLSTLTLLEELQVLRDAELQDVPKTETEKVKHTLAVLAVAVKRVNGMDVTKAQVQDILSIMTATQIAPLYGAYLDLQGEELQAGDELKNS